TRLRSADRSAPRWLGYLLNGQLQGKLLSAYKISQAFPGTPYIQTTERFLHLLPNTQDGWIAERGPRSSHRIV
ncbi:MAG: hypothetical protein ABSH01_24800, partial [Terriglobia bacterium]